MKKWWMASLLAVLLTGIIWTVRYVVDPARFPIASVQVQGRLQYLSIETLEKTVVDQLRNSFLEIDLDAIRNSVMELPWVSEVSIRRKWPDSLVVDVEERRAVARWGAGGYIDDYGRLFAPQDDGPADLPRLSAPSDEDTRRILKQFYELNQRFVSAGMRVTAMQFDSRGALRVQLDNGMEVVLGRDHIEERLKRFIGAIGPVSKAQPDAIPLRVDLRYPNGLAVNWSEALETE